ncbi:hypothetical protein Daus18300_001876 [Diaporthe australafricana]|uniref:C2H2-type domain-containing protein n=1 Tax=Diaporthe australafricana TaxID=127596 RepID=A0ABR3XTI0_9PEZI
MATIEHAKYPPIISLDDTFNLDDPHQHFHSIATVATPEQLQLLRDVHLVTSKDQTKHEEDARAPRTKDEPQLPFGSSSESRYSNGDEDSQYSPGDPTPASEAWECWEESPRLSDYNIDGETLADVFNDPLESLYQEWLGENHCENSGRDKNSSASSSTLSGALSNGPAQPDTKRKRVDNASDQEPETPPHKSRVAEKKSRKLMPLHKLLACPYFKKDPRRHRACCGFGAKKISYMKGHIYRKHAIPIYCPVCRQSFENLQLRDDHSRERSCIPVDGPQPSDGITSEQRDWLHQRGPRNLNEEQQWFRVFGFLFPGHPPPHSPYNDTVFSEDLLDFRDFIGEPPAQEILLHRVRDNPMWSPELEAIFRPDLVHGLDQLYWTWAATGHREAVQMTARVTANNSPVQETQTESALLVSEDAPPLTSDTETSSQTLRGASEDATAAVVYAVEPDSQSGVEVDAALAIGDFELPERKVDESEELPRELNHDGIAIIPPQHEGLSFDFPGLEHIEYEDIDSFVLPDDIQYDSFHIDHNFFNSGEGSEAIETWTNGFDLRCHQTSAPLEGTDEGESSVDLENTLMDAVAVVDDEKAADMLEMDEFLVIPEP